MEVKPRYPVPPRTPVGPHPWQRDESASFAATTPERPNQMSFGEKVVEAIGEFVDAKINYAETRRGQNSEWANADEVTKTGEKLQTLLDKVRFAL